MSFVDRATEALDEAEASLHSLIADALKAKAYADLAAIETMVQALGGIRRGRVADVQPAASRAEPAAAVPAPPAAPAAPARPAQTTPQPSWMRPKSS